MPSPVFLRKRSPSTTTPPPDWRKLWLDWRKSTADKTGSRLLAPIIPGTQQQEEEEVGGNGQGDLEEGDQDHQQGDGDYEEMEMEGWGGIEGMGQGDDSGDGLANNVTSLERTKATIARCLQNVTKNMSLNFRALADGYINARDLSSPVSVRVGRLTQGRTGYQSDDSSVRYTGGGSDWDQLMLRYDTAGEKEMRSISKGDTVPEKIYLCIPRDSALFPDVAEDSDKLHFDAYAKGPHLKQKGSVPFEKSKVFKASQGAIPSPIHTYMLGGGS